MQETVLIVGLGEIGHTLFKLIEEKKDQFNVYGIDIDEGKMKELAQNKDKIPSKVDTLQVCLPCNDPEKFTEIVAEYTEKFKPKLAIINSTIPPGTTLKVSQECKCLVAHSPARGVHKNAAHMLWEIKRWSKYVGGTSKESSEAAKKHFEKLGLKVKLLKSCRETELAKIFETTYRAWMIACFQEMHRIAHSFDTDFDETVDFLEDTHRVRFDRPVMYPGIIGGHCLVPNTKLLLEVYDSDFLRLILESNNKRKEEIKDSKIRAEVEKVSKRATALENELMNKKSETTSQ